MQGCSACVMFDWKCTSIIGRPSVCMKNSASLRVKHARNRSICASTCKPPRRGVPYAGIDEERRDVHAGYGIEGVEFVRAGDSLRTRAPNEQRLPAVDRVMQPPA